ncbi:MAG: hypothetical protein PF486_11950 [Prolixibacteraceae bacterium]|jgi:hypothetical protein|nr:hypothetical protein [Prolixibacteraceae bacterium]
MVYITRSNAKRIIQKIDFKNCNLEGSIYKKPIYFFNRYEKQNLLAFKSLMENPGLFYNDYYSIIRPREDSLFVLSSATPAYHKDNDCPRLKANFKNYIIPDEIIERGDAVIEKYREWFKGIVHLLDEDDEIKNEIFLERCRLRFRLTEIPEIYKKNNSGTFSIENLKLNELEENIDLFLKESAHYYYQSPKHTAILKHLSKYAYLGKRSDPILRNETGYSDKEVKEILREYEYEIKAPTDEHLREWYRVKYNPDLSFDGKLLERLGFNPCGHCHDPNYVSMQNEEEESTNSSDYDTADDLPF